MLLCMAGATTMGALVRQHRAGKDIIGNTGPQF